MAITHERVTLSQVNFEMFKFDYTDINNLNVPIITNYTSFDDVPIMNRYNVYAQMIMNGIDNMSLYDNQQNVIGSLSVDHYKIEYVTAQAYTATYLQPGEYDVDIQTSDSAYPAYQASTSSTTYIGGVQFRRVTSTVGGVPVRFKASLNGYDMLSAQDYPNIITQINDINGSWPAECVQNVLSTRGANSRPTVGLMTRTRGGVTTTYLEFVYLNNGTGFDYGATGTRDYETLIADNLNITDYIVPEVEYMNDIENRFCPRWNAGSVGMYAVSWNTIELLMQGIMELDAGDLLKNVFLGGDGKQYIIGIRWYYGLYDNANSWLNLDESKSYKVQVGGVHLDVGGADLVGKKFDGEYAHWSTSIMDVPRVLDNYLDYFADYQLYLPYFGFLKINANDIVGGTIRVHYNINLVTGMADIIVECKNSRSSRAAYKAYTVNAQIGVDIPFASDVMKTYVASWMETAGKAFMTGASMGAYGATQEYANAIQKSPRADIHQDALNLISSGDQHIMADAERAAMKNAAVSKIKTGLHNAGATAKYTGAEMSAAMSQFATSPSPSITRTGGSNPENGTLDELYPYLVITHPIDNSPADYEDYVGLPACTSIQLNQCTGFTQIAAVKPESMTDAPKYVDEILSLLQAGVYL